MPLLAELDETAFSALPDETVIGKDSFVKNEKENKYYLNLSGEDAAKLAVPLQTSVKNLELNNKKLMDEKANVLGRLEPWEKLGKTPEEIAAILKDGKTPDIKELEDKFTAQKASLETEFENKMKTVTAEIELAKKDANEAREQLMSEMLNTTIAKLRNDYGLAKAGEDVLRNRIRIVPESEGSLKMAARVFKNGEVDYKAGNFKTPEQLVEELRDDKDYSGIFIAGSGGGSGAPPTQRPTGSGGVIRVSRAESKLNPSLYKNAKDEASKTGAAIEFID